MRNPFDAFRARLDAAIERRVEASVMQRVSESAAILDASARGRADELRAHFDATVVAAAASEARLSMITARVEQIDGEVRERLDRLAVQHVELRERLDRAAADSTVERFREETESGLDRIREGVSAISIALVDQQRAHGELLEQVVARLIALEELARAAADPAESPTTVAAP